MRTRMCRFIHLLTCAGLLTSTVSAQELRHLFLDPAFLQHSENVTLRINPAQPRETVIRADQPWEKLMISFFLTVREEEGKLRMWYVCRDAENQPNLAYAESTDGVTWVKPKLGIVDYHGSKDNNLVGVPGVEGVVFKDPKARNPNEQYVYITRLKKSAMFRYFSPDGLRWQRDPQALLGLSSDTQNVTFWDENLGRYVLYLRGMASKPGVKGMWRTVIRATAEDLTKPMPLDLPKETKARAEALRHGAAFPTVLRADAEDPPESDVYNISAQPYPLDPRWYVGFPSFFQRLTNPANPSATNYGRVEVQFTGSRDGIHWERYDRTSYAKPGFAGSDTANIVFMGTGLVVRGDEIWQYGTGFHSHHGDVEARKRKTDGVIQRYVQRLDGFVSLDFDAKAGRVTTQLVKVDGQRLALNVDTVVLGHLQAGLCDTDGKAIKGFSLEDCEILRINSTRALVTWKSGADLTSLQGRDVRLTFIGRQTKIYSFFFTTDAP